MKAFAIGIMLQLIGGSIFGFALFDAAPAHEFGDRTILRIRRKMDRMIARPMDATTALPAVLTVYVVFNFIILGAVLLFPFILSLTGLSSFSVGLSVLGFIAGLSLLFGILATGGPGQLPFRLVTPGYSSAFSLFVVAVTGLFIELPVWERLIMAATFTLTILLGFMVGLFVAWGLSRFASLILLAIGTGTYALGVWLAS